MLLFKHLWVLTRLSQLAPGIGFFRVIQRRKLFVLSSSFLKKACSADLPPLRA